MSPSLVSILVPSYNQAAFIGRCLESVLAQTFGDWELFVADDGSSDGTPDLVRRYTDRRIHLLELEHRGIWYLGETYAAALERSTGELIAILDGDDYWPADKLARQVPTFESPEVVLSHGACVTVDREGRTLQLRRPPRSLCGTRPGSRMVRGLLSSDRSIPWSVTVMVRRRALLAAGGFLQPAYEPLVDFPTWLNVAMLGACVGLDEVLGFYVVHSQSVCRTPETVIVEGHARYRREFIERRSAELVGDEAGKTKLLEVVEGSRCYVLGLLASRQGERSSSVSLLARAIACGDLETKAKGLLRLAAELWAVAYHRVAAWLGRGAE
ncbi:MAG: glycosyltransferase family 2 protein [Candidatus Riflebacteria bacterium]|nr:glycosyltransferase family 2 protein [Candidatus Riflebacteria bacterium]